MDYWDDIIHNRNVCSNCFGQRRRTVSRPLSGFGAEETYSERVPDVTGVCYVPDEPPSNSRFVHCQCGSLSPGHRHWTDVEIFEDRGRFKELLTTLLTTLADLGAIDTRSELQVVADAAWGAYDRLPHPDSYGPHQPDRPTTINEALETAVDAIESPEDPNSDDADTDAASRTNQAAGQAHPAGSD